MKKRLLFLFAICSSIVKAQTFSGGGGSIPDAGPQVSFPITVSGLSPATIDTVFGLETICLSLTHTWDADLSISLQAPDGTIVSLSAGNGADGDDYINTCFNASAGSSIVAAAAPFTGTFKPQGFIGAINNGQTGNGVWNLLIQDNYAADAGTLLNWSITFGNSPATPFHFTSSNLPIVVVNCGGTPIPNEPKLAAYMGIIYNGTGVRNYLTDPFNNYNNKIGIEIRGSSSSGFPQKSYGFETRDINGTQKDTNILGMPSEHDWILYAPYDDKTCIRNVLTYDIANKTGHYASRTQLCELVIDGQYQGIYVMMEKVKRDNNRIDIAKLLPTDISGDDLTGGYILKIDRNDGPGSFWNSSFLTSSGTNIGFVHVYPKYTDIVPQQRSYIQSYVDSFEVALDGPDFADPSIGYRKYADVNSFIDYFILNELSKNVDGYRLSTYFYKDKQSNGGKLTIGPAWDYNLGWWNADYCDGSVSSGWAYEFNSVCGGDAWQVPFWWSRLMQDPMYVSELKCRWNQLRTTTLSTATLTNYVDSLAGYLSESQARHFEAWPILGTYTWPNPSPIPADYAGEITALKSWIVDRTTWLDANMPGTCTVGLTENTAYAANVNVYPNPFSNNLSVSFYLPATEKISIELTDVLGKTIIKLNEKEYNAGETTLPIAFSENNLKAGVYFLKLSSGQGTIVKKVNKVN